MTKGRIALFFVPFSLKNSEEGENIIERKGVKNHHTRQGLH